MYAPQLTSGQQITKAILVSLVTGSEISLINTQQHATYKLKWVPPDNRSEVSQAFVETVAMKDTASTTVPESTSSQLIAGLEGDDDYGYGQNCSSSAVASSTSQVKAEAIYELPVRC